MRYAACPAAIHAPLGKARSFAGAYAANSLADVKKVTLVKGGLMDKYCSQCPYLIDDQLISLHSLQANSLVMATFHRSLCDVVDCHCFFGFSSCRSFSLTVKDDKITGA